MTIENDYTDVYDYYVNGRSNQHDINSEEYQDMFKDDDIEKNDNYINYTEKPIKKQLFKFKENIQLLKIKYSKNMTCLPLLFHYNYKTGRG